VSTTAGGRAMSYTNPINLSGLNGRNGFRLDGASAGDQSGFSVAAAGDVNGDGLADILIGAYLANPNGSFSGSTYLVFGRSDGFAASLNLAALTGTNGFRLDGVAADDRSGLSATGAGDVNGDGFDDLIIGASRADVNGDNSGAAYVVYGKSGGFAAILNLSALVGTNGFRLEGVAASDLAGLKVAAAGDVNGDGFDDVIIGAQGADPNGSSSGSSYVVFGRSGGFAASLNLSALTGANGFRLDGVTTNALTGQAVASAGDVNGDGYDDLIIGSSGGSPNGSGAAYVLFGRSGVFSASVNLSSLTGPNGFRLDGSTTGDQAGFAVSSAGDVNGDGFDDVIIGAIGVGATEAGASYVVFGRASGFAANMDLSALNGTNGFRLDGVAAQDNIGRAVAAAGDVNRDGFDDLIVGSGLADPNGQTDAGTSYVLFGKSGGFAANLSLSALNGTNGYLLDGVAPGDQSGRALAGLGDVNGDGFDDLLIGAARADANGNALAGSSYVYFGTGPRSVSLSNLDGSNGFRLDGVSPDKPVFSKTGDNAGRSVASAGDLNGDGFADIIIGAPTEDGEGQTDTGGAYVVLGRAGGFASSLSLSTLDGNNGFHISAFIPGRAIGFSVAGAGDVNGDGYADLIIASPSGGFFGNAFAGTNYLIYGASGGFGAEFSTGSLNGANGSFLYGPPYGQIGLSVASAGDVNGDGYGDLIMAGTQFSNGDGGGYLVFGAAGGLGLFVDVTLLNGTNGVRFYGLEASSQLSVASAGDVNGDGFADMIIANQQANGSAGRSYVVFGKASGFPSTLDLGTLNGVNGFRLDGGVPNGNSGRSVAAAGDVNGDGFGDIIIGAPFSNGNAGASYVVFGKADGFGSSLQLSDLNGSDGFRLAGAGSEQSGSAVAAAGDINGDGYADLIIGAPRGNSGVSNTYVVFGKAGGYAASLDLSGLSGIDGYRLMGASADDAGRAVAGAGDFNGDGVVDLIIGAGNALNGAGASYVAFSSALRGAQYRGTSLADTLRGTPDNDVIRGYGQSDRLYGNAGRDNIDGGIGDDSIDGGAGNDSIDGGAGQDTGLLGGSQGAYRIGIRDGVVITSGADGLDRFVNVEALKWGAAAAVSIASLLADSGNAGLIYGKFGAAAAGYILPEAYGGPVAGLANQLLGSAGIDTVLGTERGDFVNALAGDDAVDGGAGDDVLDGGLGSNFLTGGAGVDIFFVDGRGAASFNTWGTITDFTPGELVTIWGYQPGVSQFLWVASDGAPGFQGATMHSDLDGNGLIDTSVTFSGKTQAELPTPIYGSVAGQDYIFFG